jgi:hypothetical protein
MASEQPLSKPGATGRKPMQDDRSTQPQPQQILPPLLNDGPESMRDSHC